MRSISLIKSRVPENKIETTSAFLARGGVIRHIPMGVTGIPISGHSVFRHFHFARNPNTSLAIELANKKK